MEQQQEKQSNFTAQAAEHAINPRNYGRLSRYDGRARITGPCGDTMEFWLQIKDEQVKSCTFITDGCGPSLASGSVATELARGRTLTEAAAIGQQDILSVLGGLPQEVEHCALLAADTLRAARPPLNLLLPPGGRRSRRRPPPATVAAKAARMLSAKVVTGVRERARRNARKGRSCSAA
jgi:nitrogen fixation NifU-like protein